MTEPRQGPFTAQEMRAAQHAIATVPGLRTIMTDVMVGLSLAAKTLDAWIAADQPTRNLVRRYAPELGAALDDMEAGPPR